MFRNEQRRRIAEYEAINMSMLEEMQDVYQNFFWYMINKHRKIIKPTSPIQNERGDILTNVSDHLAV